MLDDIPRPRDAFVLRLGLLESFFECLVPSVSNGVPLVIATEEIVRAFPFVLTDREPGRRRLELVGNDMPAGVRRPVPIIDCRPPEYSGAADGPGRFSHCSSNGSALSGRCRRG